MPWRVDGGNGEHIVVAIVAQHLFDALLSFRFQIVPHDVDLCLGRLYLGQDVCEAASHRASKIIEVFIKIVANLGIEH